MNIINRLKDLVTPTRYLSVEELAFEKGIDMLSVKDSTEKVLRESGKIEAIKHINKMISPNDPMPLPSTYKFVTKLHSAMQIEKSRN